MSTPLVMPRLVLLEIVDRKSSFIRIGRERKTLTETRRNDGKYHVREHRKSLLWDNYVKMKQCLKTSEIVSIPTQEKELDALWEMQHKHTNKATDDQEEPNRVYSAPFYLFVQRVQGIQGVQGHLQRENCLLPTSLTRALNRLVVQRSQKQARMEVGMELLLKAWMTSERVLLVRLENRENKRWNSRTDGEGAELSKTRKFEEEEANQDREKSEEEEEERQRNKASPTYRREFADGSRGEGLFS